MTDFKIFPKIELHAHLSGSLSDETIAVLLKRRNTSNFISDIQRTLKLGNKRSLSECFKIFHAIHLLTDTLDGVKLMTSNVIKEFHDDSVLYLELRTTPKNIQGAFTKMEYLFAVLETIRELESSLRIVVRLLVSIDRGRGIEDGWDTFRLTKELLKHETYGRFICGLDISGNPNAGSLLDYVPLLEEARKRGLKLAVHLLEVNTPGAFEEAQEIISKELVDRIGHGTFLHPESGGLDSLTNIVKEKKIPIEICITSNMKCGSVESLESHHLNSWRSENHPIAICTDDKGVFSTTLSSEIAVFQKAVQADMKAVKNVVITSLEYSFLEEEKKREMIDEIRSRWEELLTDNCSN